MTRRPSQLDRLLEETEQKVLELLEDAESLVDLCRWADDIMGRVGTDDEDWLQDYNAWVASAQDVLGLPSQDVLEC